MVALPSSVADWSRWKVTFPVGARDSSSKPQEYTGTQLATLKADDWNRIKNWLKIEPEGVEFSAPVTGVTTPNSKNVRCELRELNAKGERAEWSSTDGVGHLCVVDVTPRRLPTGKPGMGVVVEQIHDEDDDVAVWRVEQSGLWLAIGDHRKDWKLIDPNYRVGTRIQVGLGVKDGRVTGFYQGRDVHAFDKAFSGAYFKAGCYVQANAGPEPRHVSNTGAVLVHSVRVTHGAVTTPTPPTTPPPPSSTPPPAEFLIRARWDGQKFTFTQA